MAITHTVTGYAGVTGAPDVAVTIGTDPTVTLALSAAEISEAGGVSRVTEAMALLQDRLANAET